MLKSLRLRRETLNIVLRSDSCLPSMATIILGAMSLKLIRSLSHSELHMRRLLHDGGSIYKTTL